MVEATTTVLAVVSRVETTLSSHSRQTMMDRDFHPQGQPTLVHLHRGATTAVVDRANATQDAATQTAFVGEAVAVEAIASKEPMSALFSPYRTKAVPSAPLVSLMGPTNS